MPLPAQASPHDGCARPRGCRRRRALPSAHARPRGRARRAPVRRRLSLGRGWKRDGVPGAHALARGIASFSARIERFPDAGEWARGSLRRVLVGNVDRGELPRESRSPEVVLADAVSEPPAGSRANIVRTPTPIGAPWLRLESSTITNHRAPTPTMLRGRLDLADQGVMDRTHRRWFARTTYRAAVEATGLVMKRIGPVAPPGPRSRALMRLLPARSHVHFWRQVFVRARRPGEAAR